MQFSALSIFVSVIAMSQLVVAIPVKKQRNNAREKFKNEKCQSQACKDSVDSGCPLDFINFQLGGCDDPSQ
ncbi:uncharacterized protein CTRU02_201250 [Colletotrichum truncatum]|uniref:Uncharacterized protein n=1 Tax=Colletotrichum truncatum TaxID=5467 RepID=A0ACC3ZGR6_COLTU|nr:uncharacterized protein CTRU02_08039 [Colletotrichum truncatum]KAF6790519.1 hypothetical protein CTRU02_08039 [Colletotrichum truncatum]